MRNAEPERITPEIKPVSHIWHRLFKEQHVSMDGTIVEVAPGYETKIGDALALLGFRGAIILIEPDQKAAAHIHRAYTQIMPQAIVTVVIKPLQDICIGEDVPLYVDALVANHPFDDMVIAFAMPEQQISFFSREREDGIYLSSLIKKIYDTISDTNYIRGILATIAVWKHTIQKLKPACVIVSQYPGHKLTIKGLTKRQNSGSIIIEALRDFYECDVKDQYRERSFGNQGNLSWWMIARKPYIDLANDLAQEPFAFQRLGRALFVPQQARRLHSGDYDIVYVDYDYFKRAGYGADISQDIRHFAVVLDNNTHVSPATITLYADRQKDATGISLGGNLGSGRAAYYGTRYNIMGVGRTFLCTSSIPSHSTRI